MLYGQILMVSNAMEIKFRASQNKRDVKRITFNYVLYFL